MSSENLPPFIMRRLDSADCAIYREIRLEGLARAPHAFLPTYAEEADQPESWWLNVLEKNAIFGAFSEDRLMGIGGFGGK